MKLRNYILAVAIGLVLCTKMTTAVAQADKQLPDYRQEIRPLLEKHCVACHGPKKQKAMLRLDTLDSSFVGPAVETWHDVLNKLSVGEMPPADEPPIGTTARRKLIEWVRAGIDREARTRRGVGNQTVVRRLTRYEYNNTLRDLLGINLDFARDLPPEPASPDGFRNNGLSLGMSPLQIEYYLDVARLAMDKAIVEGPAPEVHKHHFEKSNNEKTRKQAPVSGNRMPPGGRFQGKMLEFPREGEFVIRVKAGASIPDGMGVPRMRVAMGLRSDTQSPTVILGEADVLNSEADKKIYEFQGRIEEFPLPGHNPKFPGVTITVSNVYKDGLETPTKPRTKAIVLNDEQKKQVRINTRKNAPKLPVAKSTARGNKPVSAVTKAIGKLQRKIEELRVISPDHKNQTDLAYRLFDANEAMRKEPKTIKGLARHLNEDPGRLLARFRETNAEQIADREVVLKRFARTAPINRKSGKRIETETAGPPRTTLVIDYLEFEGPLFKAWPPNSHTQLLPVSTEPERDRAKKSIASFMARAYRRPVTNADVNLVLTFYDSIRPHSVSFEEAMRESLAMILIAPEFLYLVEPTDEQPRHLNPHELASRLSYFLWSTMPDEKLTALANQGTLSDADVMEQQVRKMIADARSGQFVEHFTDQWLDLSGLDRVAINPEYYPTFDDRLKPMMRRETQAFFGEILQHDLSAMNFIDSDFAMLNEPLAKHYGIPTEGGPKGGDFVRVNLKPEDRRGGLLTQGSFLMTNSNGEDSHPIRRAVWVLDRLLGDPPAPPPPDVPELDSEQPDFARLPLKKQLELHRTKAACNDCHRGIDPWGVVFESFDAVGLRRESVLRKVERKSVMGPVDDDATLPNGTEVRGVEGLKSYLLEKDRDRFSRALVSKLLAYALGRSLVLEDRPSVEALVQSFENNDYRLSDLVVAIAQSEAFQNK